MKSKKDLKNIQRQTKSGHKTPKTTDIALNATSSDRYLLAGFFLMALLPFLVFSRSVSCTFYISKSAIFAWAWLIFGLPSLWLSWKNDSADRLNTPLTFSLIAFVLALVLSTIFSITPLISLFGVYERQLGLMTQIQAICMAFLTVIILKDRHKIYLFADILIVCGAINAVIAIFQFFGMDFTGFNIPLGTHAYGLQGQPDLFGSVMMFAVFLNFGRLFATDSLIKRLIFGSSLFVQTLGVLFSLTRGAWIGYLAGFFVFIALLGVSLDKERRKYYIKFILVSLLLILMVSIGIVFIFRDFFVPRIMGLLHLKGTAQTRLILYEETLRFCLNNTINGHIFGIGIESFRRAFMPFKPLRLSQLEPNVNYDDPHSNYLGILAKTGIIGFLIYAAIWWFALKLLVGIFRQTHSNNERLFLAGLSAALFAYAVDNITIFDTAASMVFFYVFLGIIISWHYIITAEKDTPVKKAVCTGQIKAGAGRTGWPFTALFAVMSIMVIINSIYYLKAWAADNKFLYGLGNVKYYETNLRGNPYYHNKPFFMERTLTLLNEAMSENPVESQYAVYYSLASNDYYDALKDINKKAAEYQVREGIKKVIGYKDTTWEPENLYLAMATAYLKLNDIDDAIKYYRIIVDDWDHQNFYTRYNLAHTLVMRADQEMAQRNSIAAKNDLIDALSQLKKGETVIASSEGQKLFRPAYDKMLGLEKEVKLRLKNI